MLFAWSCTKENRDNDYSKMRPNYSYIDTCKSADSYLLYYDVQMAYTLLLNGGLKYYIINRDIIKLDPESGRNEATRSSNGSNNVNYACTDSAGNLFLLQKGTNAASVLMINPAFQTVQKFQLITPDIDISVNNDTNIVGLYKKMAVLYNPDMTENTHIDFTFNSTGIKFFHNKFYIACAEKIIVTDNKLNIIKEFSHFSPITLGYSPWRIAENEDHFIVSNEYSKSTPSVSVFSIFSFDQAGQALIDKKIEIPESNVQIRNYLINPNNSLTLCGSKDTIMKMKDGKRIKGKVGVFIQLNNNYEISSIKSFANGTVSNTSLTNIAALPNNKYLITGETMGYDSRYGRMEKKMFVAKVDASGNYCN